MILIIVAYGAAHPASVSRGVKGSVRQEVAVPVVPAAAPVKPASTEDDDDIDLLALIGDDDGNALTSLF